MKKFRSLLFVVLLAVPSAYSQVFVGFKGGYSRFFEPGMNGGAVALFSELAFGEYESSSFRASLFYDFPMSTQDVGTLYAYPDSYELDDHVPVYSKYNNAGIMLEYLHYFMDDAYSPGLYSFIQGGLSYSTIKRTVGDYNTSVYYLNDQVKNNSQFSVRFEGGLGYQFNLGANNLLFTEVQFGFPFLQLSGSSAESSTISGYPVIGVSGNIGFKHSLFN